MKYAQFDIGYSTTGVRSQKDVEYMTEYPRLSEWVEVEFPPRTQEEIVPEKLALLANKETELRNAFQEKLDHITSERAKLLAITCKAEA